MVPLLCFKCGPAKVVEQMLASGSREFDYWVNSVAQFWILACIWCRCSYILTYLVLFCFHDNWCIKQDMYLYLRFVKWLGRSPDILLSFGRSYVLAVDVCWRYMLVLISILSFIVCHINIHIFLVLFENNYFHRSVIHLNPGLLSKV